MIEAATRITEYVHHADLDAFVRDTMAYDATVRNLEILGEAGKHIPDTVRACHPEIDWRGMAGLRDVVAHAYFAIDDATLWRIVRADVPTVLGHLRAIKAVEATAQDPRP